MGAVDLATGNVERAGKLYQQALEVFTRVGVRWEMANCVNGLAEVARLSDDLEAAERGYLRALELYDSVTHADAVVARLNLGLVRLRRGDYAGTAAVAEEAREAGERYDRPRFHAAAHCMLLAVAGAEGRWDAWDEHYRVARQLLDETGHAEADNGWCAWLAGTFAEEVGDVERARDAWELGWSQYEALDDEVHTAELEQRIAQLPRG